MNYKYYIYGLNIESELEIEEAYIKDFPCEPDVKVTIGELPDDLWAEVKDIPGDQFFIRRAPEAAVFRIANLADYFITADHIVIRPIGDINDHLIRTYLLGSSFGLCAVLRNHVMIHGGATRFNGKGIIVTGESGAGKSTISNKLLELGGQFIADDVCAVTIENGNPHINMAYPQQKLCRDAALARGYDLSELIYINESRDKFALRLKDNYLVEGADFNYLFELVLTDDDEVSIEKITGFDMVKMIHQNIYRGTDAFSMWGMAPVYMKKCLDIASKLSAYRISRPREKATVSEILEMINKAISE